MLTPSTRGVRRRSFLASAANVEADERHDHADTTDAALNDEPTDANDPTEPIDNADPTEPIDSTESVDATLRNEFVERQE